MKVLVPDDAGRVELVPWSLWSPALITSSDWVDVRGLKDWVISAWMLSITGTTPFFSLWAATTEGNFQTDPDPANWNTLDLPVDRVMAQTDTGPDTSPVGSPSSLVRRNLFDQINTPTKKIGLYRSNAAHFVKLKAAFSGSYAAGQGATVRAFLIGK